MTRDGKEGPSDISHIIQNPVCTFDQDDADRVLGMRSRSDISQSISNLVKSSRMKSDPSISSKSRSKGGPSSPRPRSRAKPRSRSRARSRSRSRPSVMCKSRATENSRSRSASRSRRLVRTNSESSGSISRSKDKRARSRSRNVVRAKPGSESRIVRANSESSGSISRSKDKRARSRSRNVVRVKPGSELRSRSRSRSKIHEDTRMTANSRPRSRSRSRSRSRPEMRANSRSNDEHSSRSRSTSRSRSKHRTDKKRWKHHPQGNRKPSREKKRWKHHPGKNLKGNDPLLNERNTKGYQETRSPVVTKRSPSHDIRDQKVGDACAPPLILVNDVREQRSFGSRAQSISPISDLEGNDSSSEVAYSPRNIGDKDGNAVGFLYHDELGRLEPEPRSSMATVVSIFNTVLNCLGVCRELQTEVKQATSCSPQSDKDFLGSPQSDNGCMSPFGCGESGETKNPSMTEVDQFDVNGRFGELFKNEGKWKPIKVDLDRKIEKIASDLEPFDDGEDSVLGGSDDLSDVAQNRAYGRGWWHLLRKGIR